MTVALSSLRQAFFFFKIKNEDHGCLPYMISEKVPRQGSKNYAIKQPLAFPTIPQSFVMFYFTMLGYIFGIDCQTTLQVQEKLISRLPVEIYVQLRCYCCVRILGNIGALQKY